MAGLLNVSILMNEKLNDYYFDFLKIYKIIIN